MANEADEADVCHVCQDPTGVENLADDLAGVPGRGSPAVSGKKVVWVGNAPGGNYTDRLLEAARASSQPGRVTFEVRHDEWCALLGGRGPCNCDPEVVEVPR